MNNFSSGDFVAALGLAFVLEGLIFLAMPGIAQRIMTVVVRSPASQIRVAGLMSAALGLFVLWLARG